MPRDLAPIAAAMRRTDAADITDIIDLRCPLRCRGTKLQRTFDLYTEGIGVVHQLVALIHENAPKFVGRPMRLVEPSTASIRRDRQALRNFGMRRATAHEAFDALPKGTVDNLVKPENKDTLTKILTYHVVSGRYTARDLMELVAKGGGKASLTSVPGEPLTVMQSGNALTATDAKGGVAHITIGDVMQSNGVIHVVDKVLMP
jgi:hypothetical protein